MCFRMILGDACRLITVFGLFACAPLPEQCDVVKEQDTRYAMAGDVHIAFQVTGADNGLDIVLMPHWAGHVELMWEDPAMARLLRRLGSRGRLIRFDRRGTGLSDPVLASSLPTLETWADDIDAVLKAVGSKGCAIIAADVCCFIGAFYAATRPERVHSLVLVNGTARLRRADNYPCGLSDSALDAFVSIVEGNWGQDWLAGETRRNPTVAADREEREFSARYARASASPSTMIAMTKMLIATDVRAVLPLVRVNTLVLHRKDDAYIPSSHGRFLAEHIAGAEYVELPGADHDIEVGDMNALAAEIERLLVGHPGAAPPQRVLATVLFTDIVGSTERLAAIGDAVWRTLLDRHNDVVRRQLARFNGTEIRTIGDSFLAIFDGPARGVKCALSIRDALRPLGIDVRAGLHTGEIEMTDNDIAGLAVHIASRVSSLAGAAEVLVSRTVVDLTVGSGIDFVDYGEYELKGVPNTWQIFRTASA